MLRLIGTLKLPLPDSRATITLPEVSRCFGAHTVGARVGFRKYTDPTPTRVAMPLSMISAVSTSRPMPPAAEGSIQPSAVFTSRAKRSSVTRLSQWVVQRPCRVDGAVGRGEVQLAEPCQAGTRAADRHVARSHPAQRRLQRRALPQIDVVGRVGAAAARTASAALPVS
jgi:hypothetical protein